MNDVCLQPVNKKKKTLIWYLTIPHQTIKAEKKKIRVKVFNNH